jgi:hypothetical protein
MSGVQCQTCKQAGRETWVIPGKACHICGTLCGLLVDGMFVRGISRQGEVLTGCNRGRDRIRIREDGHGRTYNVSFDQGRRPVCNLTRLAM